MSMNLWELNAVHLQGKDENLYGWEDFCLREFLLENVAVDFII